MFEILAQCSHVEIPPVSEEAMKYYRSGMILWAIQQAWALLLPWLFLATGLSAKLLAVSEKWCKKRYFCLALYLTLFIGLYKLFKLPLSFYASYIRPHAYGLSTAPLSLWWNHYGKSFFLLLFFALATVWILYWLLRKSPKRWWLWSSFVAIVLSFLTIIVQPIWIDPLFNQFGPMKDKELEQRILDLASQAGIEEGRIFEVNKSQETKTLNAYVIGFGSTKRIVLWDTLLQKMTPSQTLFVMSHEMGHYVLGHMWWGFLYYSILFIVVFFLANRWALRLLARFQKSFGFYQLSSFASLPLLLFVLNALSLLTDPLSNYVSRTMERQADRFGLDLTQNSQAAAEAFVILQQSNLANPRPDPLFYLLRASHPSLQERVDFANNYCPWKE